MATQAEDLEQGDDEWRRENYDEAHACYRRVVAGPDQGVHWQTAWARLAKLAEDRQPVWGCTSNLYHKEGCPARNMVTRSGNIDPFPGGWRRAWASGRRPHMGRGGASRFHLRPSSARPRRCSDGRRHRPPRPHHVAGVDSGLPVLHLRHGPLPRGRDLPVRRPVGAEQEIGVVGPDGQQGVSVRLSD